ncbi:MULTISPECIES: OmpA family protein [Enterobacter]|uniref:OmpA family protein n=1 Tax=Enterobacter TaxID=547 RepID=UPI0004838E95|nr:MULTISPECIES: OmpA family protein [Enterobacter cloacae complex]HDT2077476.1 OmpA family protein [Enterobacter roggenkampii]HEG2000056.1 OmpA family protein [Enterobacter asburiae]MCD2460963.1 OmpA family protein [Enterobacter cloacae complex sp. 2021EL-01261]MDT9873538.1 OmpA family protein [Enterobacter cloacae]HDT2097737.1 OmpA family protein [Enterobacter roggenkampii]
MRRSALLRAVFPVLICLAAALWVLWGFLNVSALFKSALTLAGIILALLVIRRRYRRQQPAGKQADEGVYPPFGFTGPVLLVCGDLRDHLFTEGGCRTTAQGCYLNVGATDQLSKFADRLLAREPRMAGQLVVMFRCLPDLHEDEGLLRASLKVLRQQVKQLKDLSGYLPPVVLVGEFFGPETPWIVIRGKTPLVCPADEPALTLDEWRALPQNVTRLPYLSHAMSMLQQVVMDELTKVDSLCPAVTPFAVVVRSGSLRTLTEAVWPQWLFRHSKLLPPVATATYPALWHFADPVLPLLAPFAMPLQGGKTGRRVVMFLLFCIVSALGLSVLHNQSLIGRIASDLQRWYAIPMTHYAPKAQSLYALQQDALLLERWQRQGEPQRYGLGLYPGDRLWLSVQQAIDTYVPPPPPPKPKVVPKIVRLDSMSLFDSGKFELKSGSTKLLVNSLVGIKAKPGWLIVVSGHTDNTGNPQLNQTLSLKRAEAVRDWMRDTGDVPESCFAVQGYGESRPVATNDTPEGRALNRRVEISLVPQANACQIPGKTSASSQDDDVSQH